MSSQSHFKSSYGVFLALLAVLVWNLATLYRVPDWGDDYAQYISQAQAFVSHNYTELARQSEFCQHYNSRMLGPNYYPWGFPLLIAPVIAVVGVNYAALQAWMCLFFAAFLLVLWLLFRKKLDRPAVMMLLLCFALNPYLFEFKRNIVSDIPFLLLCFLCILLIQKVIVGKRWSIVAPLQHVVLGVVIFAAIFVRSIGVVLIAVLFCCQAIEWFRERKSRSWVNYGVQAIPYGVIGALYALAAYGFHGFNSSYPIHDPENRNVFVLMGGNLLRYLIVCSDFFRAPAIFRATWGLQLSLFSVTIILMVVGIRKRFREDYHYIVFLICYFVTILLIPYLSVARYLFPIWPLCLYFAFHGLAVERRGFLDNINLVKVCAIPLIVYFALNTLFLGCVEARRVDSCDGPETPEFQAVVDFIRTNTPTSSKINFNKPRLVYLKTGRLSASQQDDANLREIESIYTIVDKKLATAPKNMDNKHIRVFSNSRFDVFYRENGGIE